MAPAGWTSRQGRFAAVRTGARRQPLPALPEPRTDMARLRRDALRRRQGLRRRRHAAEPPRPRRCSFRLSPSTSRTADSPTATSSDAKPKDKSARGKRRNAWQNTACTPTSRQPLLGGMSIRPSFGAHFLGSLTARRRSRSTPAPKSDGKPRGPAKAATPADHAAQQRLCRPEEEGERPRGRRHDQHHGGRRLGQPRAVARRAVRQGQRDKTGSREDHDRAYRRLQRRSATPKTGSARPIPARAIWSTDASASGRGHHRNQHADERTTLKACDNAKATASRSTRSGSRSRTSRQARCSRNAPARRPLFRRAVARAARRGVRGNQAKIVKIRIAS